MSAIGDALRAIVLDGKHRAYLAEHDPKVLAQADTAIEDEDAAADREARPFVVGEVDKPGVIERFATHDEAAKFIEITFEIEDVAAGLFYIDGPEV